MRSEKRRDEDSLGFGRRWEFGQGCALAGLCMQRGKDTEGARFGAMLTVFAFFLLVMLAFAARGVAEKWAVKFGPAADFSWARACLCFYLVYLLERERLRGARRRDGRPDLRAAGIAVSAGGAAPGACRIM